MVFITMGHFLLSVYLNPFWLLRKFVQASYFRNSFALPSAKYPGGTITFTTATTATNIAATISDTITTQTDMLFPPPPRGRGLLPCLIVLPSLFTPLPSAARIEPEILFLNKIVLFIYSRHRFSAAKPPKPAFKKRSCRRVIYTAGWSARATGARYAAVSDGGSCATGRPVAERQKNVVHDVARWAGAGIVHHILPGSAYMHYPGRCTLYLYNIIYGNEVVDAYPLQMTVQPSMSRGTTYIRTFVDSTNDLKQIPGSLCV